MKCTVACDLIPLYVGDDLGAEAADLKLSSQLEEHLEHCKLCEFEYVGFANARHALLGAKGLIDTESLESIWQEIDSSLPSTVSWHKRALAAISLVAASVMVILVSQQQGADPVLNINTGSNQDSFITSNLEDISPPVKLMSADEVQNFLAGQRQLEDAQILEEGFVDTNLDNQRPPTASMAGIKYPKRRNL
ncbi:MAG: hypothetical protein ACI84O_000657 [Myxococcota bacterium]